MSAQYRNLPAGLSTTAAPGRAEPTSFDGESLDARPARRTQRGIADVQFVHSPDS
jgi:hypothetical protein